MSVQVTGRHVSVTAGLQVYARRRAEEVEDAFREVTHVRMILDREGAKCMTEVVAQVKRHGPVEASAVMNNMKGAVDAALEKAVRQLRRLHERICERKSRGGKGGRR